MNIPEILLKYQIGTKIKHKIERDTRIITGHMTDGENIYILTRQGKIHINNIDKCYDIVN